MVMLTYIFLISLAIFSFQFSSIQILGFVLGANMSYAAIGLAIIMLGAIYFKIAVWKIGFVSKQNTGWELDIMILASCLILSTLGSGDISVDSWMTVKPSL